MLAKQEAKLRMYRAVQDYCVANNAIISTNAAFMTAFGDFGVKINAINSAAQQSEQILTGIAEDKNVIKENLSRMAAEIAGVIYAYAAAVGDMTLKNQMDLKYSDLVRSREDMLAPRCQNIHDAGVERLTNLAPYGITADKLASLQTEIEHYSEMTPKPRTAYSQRKAVNESLVALFDETDAILKDRMDRLVELFRAAHPNFVQTYEATRRIVSLPTTHTQLKLRVTDQTDGAPVANAQITAAPTENGHPPQTAQTDAAGEYNFKPFPHGICNVTVTATGYQNYQTQTDVMMGEVNDLEVELVK